MWRLLLSFLLVLSSLAPHCALASPPAMATQHHAGMDHGKPQPGHVHAAATCIGCATPVRHAPVIIPEPPVRPVYDVRLPSVMTTIVHCPESPPPRSVA